MSRIDLDQVKRGNPIAEELSHLAEVVAPRDLDASIASARGHVRRAGRRVDLA